MRRPAASHAPVASKGGRATRRPENDACARPGRREHAFRGRSTPADPPSNGSESTPTDPRPPATLARSAGDLPDPGLYSQRGQPPRTRANRLQIRRIEGRRARDLVGRARKLIRPPAPLFRLIETDRASERRRPTPARTSATARLFRDRHGRRDRRSATRREWFGLGVATDRKGGAVALIRACTH